MATDDDLIAKLGSTNANDRAIVERGTAMLPALDAIVTETAQPMPRRMAATRVANEIRARALRAPVAPAVAQPEPGEARAYFAAGGTLHSDHQQDPAGFVEKLYAAGAVLVTVTTDRASLVAELPASARDRLFAIYNAQVDQYGEEFGGEEPPGHEMTADEAAAIGAPDAAGEWVADDLRIADHGQSHLRFWWD